MTKNKDTKAKKEDNIIEVERLIIKEFGDVLTSADYVKSLRNIIIPVTPKLNMILGGGVPEGTFMIISGPPKLGKSQMSLQIAGNAQKILSTSGDRKVYYFDIEGRIKYRDLQGNKNLDLHPDKFTLIQSKEGNILTGDKFIDIAEKLINTRPGCVFILDSLSSICTQSRQDGNIGDRVRDDAPLLLSNFCKRISQVIAINKSIIIGITHRIANQGQGHAKWVEASGTKIQYQGDCKLVGQYFKAWQTADGNPIGQEVFWQCAFSGLGPPGKETNSWLKFGEGFDEVQELIDIGSDTGIIQKGGSWYTFEDIKVQGAEKLRLELVSNKEKYNSLKKQVDAIYKV